MMRVLNVGGGASRQLPSTYDGWEQHLLDIDKDVKPDICCDARDIGTLKSAVYDAVFCSHNLEHFYRHDVPVVLGGFAHILKPSGFVHVAVPDLMAVMEAVVKGNLDVMDTWYRTPAASISFHDVLYGWNRVMAEGNLYYAHKCGFSYKSLSQALRAAGFKTAHIARDGYSLIAFAFKTKPSEAKLRSLGI